MIQLIVVHVLEVVGKQEQLESIDLVGCRLALHIRREDIVIQLVQVAVKDVTSLNITTLSLLIILTTLNLENDLTLEILLAAEVLRDFILVLKGIVVFERCEDHVGTV